MAKPINIKDHNASFIKFLIFFVVTLAMAVIAIYFNFKIPAKELKMLRKNSETLRTQQLNQEIYKRTLNEVMYAMDNLDKSDNLPLANSTFQEQFDELRRASNIDDSSSSQRLSQVIFKLVNEYRLAKINLVKCKNVDSLINKKDIRIKEILDDLERCTDKLRTNNIQ